MFDTGDLDSSVCVTESVCVHVRVRVCNINTNIIIERSSLTNTCAIQD